MTHKTNCTAYIVTAINKNTGLLEGYCDRDTPFFELASTIWNARFMMTLKSAIAYRDLLIKGMAETMNGDPLDWKIQEVSLNAPIDVK